MKKERVKWARSQNDIGRLSAVLRPVRTHREVASLMGVSVTLVCQLECSALAKIRRAMTDYDNNEKDELSDNIELEKHPVFTGASNSD